MPQPEIAAVARHVRQVAPLLIALLDDDPDSGEEMHDWRVQQAAAAALCRIYGIKEECGHLYCNRATRDENKAMKVFWTSKVRRSHQQ